MKRMNPLVAFGAIALLYWIGSNAAENRSRGAWLDMINGGR